jgi:hypothetical protein
MKLLTQIFTVVLFLGLSFGCAQSQDTGDKEKMEKEEMMKEDMSSAVQFIEAHKRGNEESRTSPNAAVMQTIGTMPVTITYGRPGMRGRVIFGDLVPYDEVWRTGANESAVITFPKDVTIEGKSLKAGSYSLYTVPGEDNWTIVFNSKTSWGTQYDKSEDALRVQTQSKSAETPMEQFMIYFQNVTDSSAEVVLQWDETKVPFTVEV